MATCGEQAANRKLALTPRQVQVLMLIAQGKSNKLIARELGVAPGTVKCHVAMLLRTLNVATRTQAALLGAHNGSPPSGVFSADLRL
jgi:DNA-binding NarL/FixJ family response regulator